MLFPLIVQNFVSICEIFPLPKSLQNTFCTISIAGLFSLIDLDYITAAKH